MEADSRSVIPYRLSVNDGVHENLCLLSYVSVDDALWEICMLGRGSLLAKVDVRKAYKNVPIHLDDWRLLGTSWEGRVFVDTALPFGLRSAPKTFTAPWLMWLNGCSTRPE